MEAGKQSGSMWKRLVEEGVPESALQPWALRAAPPDLAKEMVTRSLRSVMQAEGKALVCDLKFAADAYIQNASMDGKLEARSK